METKQQQLEVIHNSLVNGQRQQMVKQIDDYSGGHYEFWADYRDFLVGLYSNTGLVSYFVDATVSYFRIKNR